MSGLASELPEVLRSAREVGASLVGRAGLGLSWMNLGGGGTLRRSGPSRAGSLRAIPELELIEPAVWEICCGSAGIHNLLQPEAGRALGRRKAENLLATGAEAVASGNPGCTLQIAAHLREQGRPLPIYHPMELLDRSIRDAGRP